MMKRLILSVACVGLMAGCLRTRGEVQELEEKRNLQDQVVNLQKNNADQSSKYSEIDTTIRDLNGRVEVLENKLNVSAQEKEQLKKSSDEQISDLNKRVLVLQESVSKLEGVIQSLQSQKTEAKTDVVADAKNPLAAADNLFNSKEWAKAALEYNKYREAHPKAKLTAIATYRMGVCFEELGKTEDARTFYDEVAEKFPQTKEAKSAKYRTKRMKK